MQRRVSFVLMILIVLLLIVLVVFLVVKKNPLQQDEKNRAIRAIAKHVILPDSEIPELMQINSQSVIDSQVFFKKAEVGDIVLVYMDSGQAVLYSKRYKKVINMGPLRFEVPSDVVQTGTF